MSLTIQSGGSITLQGGAGGGGAISAAGSAQLDASNFSTSSTSYVQPSTPMSVTLTTGESAVVTLSMYVTSSGAPVSLMSVGVSGATTIVASDATSTGYIGAGASWVTRTMRMSNLTPGANTFTAHFRVTGGSATWTGGTANLTVLALA